MAVEPPPLVDVFGAAARGSGDAGSAHEGGPAGEGEAPAGEAPAEARARLAGALRRNRLLQASLRRALAAAGEAGAAAQGQHLQLRRYAEEQPRDRRLHRPHSRILASIFSDPRRPHVAPPRNAEAVRRALFREAYLASLACRPWAEAEDRQLEAALRMQLQEEAFRRLYAERTRSGQLPQAEKPRAFQEASREIRDARTEDLWEMQRCRTDWRSVSRRLRVRGVRRDEKSCFTRFVQVLHPRVNRGPFTKREDMVLLQLASARGGFSWDAVAEALGSGRTPWQCFARYQRSLNPSLARGRWTPEETCRALGLRSRSCASRAWAVLAAQLGEGRLAQQVRERTLRTAEGPRGGWSALERGKLRLLAHVYGRSSWVEVARHLPGRSPSACAGHFWEVEFEGLRRRPAAPSASASGARGKRAALPPWTEGEEAALLRGIERYGAGNWSLVRRELPGRTTLECFRRFQKLNPSSMADMYDVLLATQGKMIPRRFVPEASARRKRSELVAADFALRLFEVPGGKDAGAPGAPCFTVLTTGDERIDRHLQRVNQRRWRRYCEMSKSLVPQGPCEAADGEPKAKRRRRVKGRRARTCHSAE